MPRPMFPRPIQAMRGEDIVGDVCEMGDWW